MGGVDGGDTTVVVSAALPHSTTVGRSNNTNAVRVNIFVILLLKYILVMKSGGGESR